jgi:ferredoxin
MVTKVTRKKVHHVVNRPGRRLGDPDVEIPIAEELATTPGVVENPVDVDFYSRKYPLESQAVTHTADRNWVWTVYHPEEEEAHHEHERMVKPLVDAARASGDIEPTAEAIPGKDVTAEIKLKARELGFGEVGITRYDRRYTFAYKKKWAKYEHAICVAYEQDYERTQAIPGSFAEFTHFGTYRSMSQKALLLADYIRSLGYHAQIHSPNDNSAAYIPMFVAAGLGQLGANGQLLSPHFGSRARLLVITTDAIVSYDQPIDYGIHKFCEQCQVCINRCPGRALMRDKVWWRGVQKHKLVYENCRPVMARYSGCGICMKVCPVQKYGMPAVMKHYVETNGQILGKGTHELEGYNIEGKGYYGPGELPHFDRDFFQIPHGKSEDVLFEKFKEQLKKNAVPDGPAGDLMLRDFKKKIQKIVTTPVEDAMAGKTPEEA